MILQMQPKILVTSRRFIYIYIIWVIDRAGIRPRHAQNVTLVLFCAVIAIALRHHPAQSQRRTSELVFLHLPDSKARYSRGRRPSPRTREQRSLRGKMCFAFPKQTPVLGAQESFFLFFRSQERQHERRLV